MFVDQTKILPIVSYADYLVHLFGYLPKKNTEIPAVDIKLYAETKPV